MTDPTARDLIQRLADELTAHHQLPGRVPLINEARAYLAQPESDGPAEPEGSEPASVAYEPSGRCPRDDAELRVVYSQAAETRWRNGFDESFSLTDMERMAHTAGLHAVLARYGHQSPRPIPLSERQPTEADCDADGWVWAAGPAKDWRRTDWRMKWENTPYLWWLPHWALPVPQEVE